MPGPIKVVLRREPIPRSKLNRAHVEIVGPGGEWASHEFKLPWLDETEWQAVVLSLELQEEEPRTWPQGNILQKAQKLHLFLQGSPSDDRFKIIGKTLYDAVFGSEEIKRILYRLLHLEDDIPVLEFHIQDEGSILQAYPWELWHDGERFLFRGYNAFPVRHVNFEESIAQIELTEAMNVLYIAPRPNMASHGDYANLPIREGLHLESLHGRYSDHLTLESLPSNTLDALHEYFIASRNRVQVVHIDAHGGFGWLCRRKQCKWLNPTSAKQCSKCGQFSSKDQKSLGYLAFETSDRGVHWISGDDLGDRLNKRRIPVVVLSACQSGLVGGKSTFNSVAGALVKQRIPAVVAMQLSVEVGQAEKFVEFFYNTLANRKSLTEAVAEARISMLNHSWYRPALYLRTDPNNYRGTIFRAAPKEAVSPRELVAEWKRMHHECQELLNELNVPLKDLQEYSRTGEKSRLRTASAAWASRCIPMLKNIPDRWESKNVQIPEFGNLREQITMMENIHSRLVQIEQMDPEFWVMYLQVETLHGTLWRLLYIADGRISRLLEYL